MSAESTDLNQLSQKVEEFAPALELSPPGTLKPSPPASLTDQRRLNRPGPRRDVIVLSLVERQGAVFWEIGSPVRPELRRSRRAPSLLGRIISRKETPVLNTNEIVAYLEKTDLKLTPYRGLRTWTGKALVPCSQVAQSGKILLFVHGTFSNSDHLIDAIRNSPRGSQWLGQALAGYNQILTFDHATLSTSPIVNAMDLRTALGSSQAEVDIVTHSRGGLVSRWWLEVLDPFAGRKRRAVFVGSPLIGTSLAAPGRLRSGLKLLSTYGSLLGQAAMAAPLLTAPAALLRIFASLVSAAASVPLIDAGVAMIPGLNGQSRVDNSIELSRLNGPCKNCPGDYFFVTSNFDPASPGWNVLKWIRSIGTQTLNALADNFVFPGDNDLVVDTDAMTAPWTVGISDANRLKHEPSAGVHHTNYFQAPATIEFIASSLK
jgi:hypothetical protein